MVERCQKDGGVFSEGWWGIEIRIGLSEDSLRGNKLLPRREQSIPMVGMIIEGGIDMVEG